MLCALLVYNAHPGWRGMAHIYIHGPNTMDYPAMWPLLANWLKTEGMSICLPKTMDCNSQAAEQGLSF